MPVASRGLTPVLGLPRESTSSLQCAGGKTRTPAWSILKVCSPGTVACPRILMMESLRTTELRCTLCCRCSSPSATVRAGRTPSSRSVSKSVRRKVVACQLVIMVHS